MNAGPVSILGTLGAGERRIAAAPVAVRVMLAMTLAVQIGWHAWRPDPRAEAHALRPAPPAAVLRLAALGDETVLARLLMLRLQAHDNQPGVSIPFMDLDYGRVAGWLDAIVDLDPRADYPLLAAARLYGSVPDPARQRVMFELVHRRFLEDPGRRWPWLAHAAVLAKHRLGDPALALRYARALAGHAAGPEAPARVRGMSAIVAADAGGSEAARVFAGGLPARRQRREQPPGRHTVSPSPCRGSAATEAPGHEWLRADTPLPPVPLPGAGRPDTIVGTDRRAGRPGLPAIRTRTGRLRPCHASNTASPSSRSRSC